MQGLWLISILLAVTTKLTFSLQSSNLNQSTATLIYDSDMKNQLRETSLRILKITSNNSLFRSFIGSMSNCSEDVNAILGDLFVENSSAVLWLDAAGRPMPGVYGGAKTWPGSFELCLNIPESTYGNREHIAPHYCSVVIRDPVQVEYPFNMHLGWTIGLCLPKSCSTKELVSSVNNALSPLNLTLNEDASYCHTSPEQLPSNVWFWVGISSMVLCFTLLFIGIVFDLILWFDWNRKREKDEEYYARFAFQSDSTADLEESDYPISTPTSSVDCLHSFNSEHLVATMPTFAEYRADYVSRCNTAAKLISAFSVSNNIQRLSRNPQSGFLDVDAKSFERQLDCLDGIRVLTLCWAIYVHCALTVFTSNNADLFLNSTLPRWSFQAVLSGSLASDTFFLLSGCLVAYTAFVQPLRFNGYRSRCRFWCFHIIHRFLRLTPSYIFVLLFYTGLFVHLSDGPLYPQHAEWLDVGFCRKHWWVTYLNNFLYTEQMCMPWTWQLANEFQFSIILAPLYVLLMTWSPIAGSLFVGALIFTSIGCTYGIAYSKRFLPGMLSPHAFEDILIKPYTRWGTYAMGLLLGWLLAECRRMRWKPPKRVKFMLTTGSLCIAAVLCLATVYGLTGVADRSRPPLRNWVAALYTALHRPVFSLGVAITLSLCVLHWAVPINAVLSWSGFRTAARLSYGVYLIHPIVIQFIVLGGQMPLLLNTLTLITLFLAVSVISFAIAFPLSLIAELPVSSAERLFGFR